MKSFDFYDTLFTRLVADPTDIFKVMEEILSDPGFAARRKAAELAARRSVGWREVNLEDIYRQLKPAQQNEAEVIALELKLERELISPIVGNLVSVGDTDLVISDMYLPASLLQSIIEDYRVAGEHPPVIVSNEAQMMKSDGTLWRHLCQKYPGLHWHIGDNKKADVQQPRKMGLETEHFRDAELNRYEKRYVNMGSLDGSLIAGLSRATRLSSPANIYGNASYEKAIDIVFSSVIAPLLISFVEHVIDDAERQGISQLYFLARDGQLLHRIAVRIIAARQLPLQAHYIYASRHALHLPGLTNLDLAESWLLEDTPHLSLAEIAARGELPAELITEVGRKYGFNSLEENIPNSRRPELKKLVRAPEIEAQLRANSTAKWQLALDYYEQVGIKPGSQVILVDVGWTGRMQASLRALLDKAGTEPVSLRGHYLCLNSKLKVSDYDSLYGFLHDPESDLNSCAFNPYRCVVEACLTADHGTTLGFQRVNEVVQPVLGDSLTPEGREVIERQQSTVLRFLEHMLKVETVRGRRIAWPKGVLANNLSQMLQDPKQADADAFSDRGFFEGQADNLESQIVRRVSPGPGWLRRKSLGLWPEGSLTLSGGRSLLGLVRVARWLKIRAQG